jgi:hypothetical protein
MDGAAWMAARGPSDSRPFPLRKACKEDRFQYNKPKFLPTYILTAYQILQLVSSVVDEDADSYHKARDGLGAAVVLVLYRVWAEEERPQKGAILLDLPS